MFDGLETAPPDPILGLTEAFKADANPRKINLGVGVYQDADGATSVLDVVKEAERGLVADETSKAYKPISGDPAFGSAVQQLVLGAGSDIIASKRAATAHTPGGTGALRVAGDYLQKTHRGPTIWLSDPTWANHPAVFKATGLPVRTYAYFDAGGNGLDFDAMLGSLRQVPAGDVVLLHAGCHNPTGVDPTPEQWSQIGQVLAECGAVPLMDFAYQGFADGVEADAVGVRTLCDMLDELIVCSSFSKNLGLYNERCGAMTVIAKTADAAAAVMSHVRTCIRTNYSNPPAHGAAIVTTVLGDAELRGLWEEEVATMRDRINGMRRLFARSLADRGVNLSADGNDFIIRQRGMFSFSGLNKDQVQALRDRYAIYLVGSGRINVAGMSEQNMPYLCDAIAEVTASG